MFFETLSRIWVLIEKISGAIFRLCFRVFGKEYTCEAHKSLMQFVKFGMVGISNTAIYYLLYTLSLSTIRESGIFNGIDYVIASIIAFMLSVLWSFYWNNKMVFAIEEGQTRNLWRALIKTYI